MPYELTVYRYLQGESIQEIADNWGLSYGAIYKRLRRARIDVSKRRPRKWGAKKRGQFYIGSDGYEYDRTIKRGHKHIRVHILMMEQFLGRRLNPGEVVHHKDHNQSNNYIDNLVLHYAGDHLREHHLGVKNLRKGRPGHPVSHETRYKMSQARARYWAKRREQTISD